jgi:hypothetical protein
MNDQPDSSSVEPWEDQSDGSFILKPRHDPAIDSHHQPLADQNSICKHIRDSDKTQFKQPTSFNPTVEQAKTIKFEFGWSPELRRLNRHERLALKLSALNFDD